MNELAFFKLNGADFAKSVKPLRGSRYIKPPKCREIAESRLKYRHAQDLARELAPEKGMRAFCVVDGTFVFGDYIEALITEHNLHVKCLTISTLSMSENNVDSLLNLLEGNYVDSLNLIVSDYFYSHERHNLVPYIYEELDRDDKFQFAVAATHCKLCLIETHCGLKIVMHGSANLRSASCIEQFCIEENEALFDFNFEFQKAILDKYFTIQKAVRHTTLWQAVQK